MPIQKTFRPHHHYLLGFLSATFILMIILVLASFQPSPPSMALADESAITRLTRTSKKVEYPQVLINQPNRALVVWQEWEGFADGYDIFATRLDENGHPITLPWRVNQYDPGDQKFPRMAMDGQGNFVVVWQSYGQDGSGAGIFGQRFDAGGNKMGSEFRVSTERINNQLGPDVAMNATGEFAVAWVSENQRKIEKSIYTQLYDADGKPVGKEFRANQSALSETSPAIAIDNQKNVLVVWQKRAAEAWQIRGRIFDWEGKTNQSQDIVISPATPGQRTNPRLALTKEGNFMVVWEDYTESKQYQGITLQYEAIAGQVLSVGGTALGAAFAVSEPARPHHEYPGLTITPDGAVVTWHSYHKNEDVWTVSVQKIDAQGGRAEGPLKVIEGEMPFHWMPAVAANPEGDVVIAWIRYQEEKHSSTLELKWYKKPPEPVIEDSLLELLEDELEQIQPAVEENPAADLLPGESHSLLQWYRKMVKR